jgi:hypothetical protein
MPMAVDVDPIWADVESLLRQIHGIMEPDPGCVWIRHIDDCLRYMDVANAGNHTRYDALMAVWEAVKSLYPGGRGLGDYVIQRDDPNARIQANRELDQAMEQLWKLLADTLPYR